MSLISRVTTWALNQLVTSSALNGEFDNVVNVLNNLDAASTRWTNVDATTYKYAGNTLIPILQRVQSTSTSGFSTTSNAYQTTNLTASITPKSTSSVIFIWAASDLQVSTQNKQGYATLARAGSNLLAAGGQGSLLTVTGGSTIVPCSLCYMDSPASTSSLIYSVQIKNNDGVTTVGWGGNCQQNMILIELAA